MNTTPRKGRLLIASVIDGGIEFHVGRASVLQREFWQILTARAGLTTAALAEHLDISRRTVEGWRQGRPIAARYRAALHSFITTLNEA